MIVDMTVTYETDDEYADVPDMFRSLRAAAEDSSGFTAQHEQIVTRCLPLADNIAHRYSNRGQDLDDLIQVARLGLLQAVNRFDPQFGSSFTAYAVPTIIGEVRRYFRDRTWPMSVPRRMKDHHTEIAKAIPEMMQHLGRAPSVTELAGFLGVDRDAVIEGIIASDARSLRSLDQPLGHDTTTTAADTVGCEDERLQAVTDRESVRPLVAGLPERERAILLMRFFEGQTQSQIAQRLGLSQMHVSRLLTKTWENCAASSSSRTPSSPSCAEERSAVTTVDVEFACQAATFDSQGADVAPPTATRI